MDWGEQLQPQEPTSGGRFLPSTQPITQIGICGLPLAAERTDLLGAGQQALAMTSYENTALTRLHLDSTIGLTESSQ